MATSTAKSNSSHLRPVSNKKSSSLQATIRDQSGAVPPIAERGESRERAGIEPPCLRRGEVSVERVEERGRIVGPPEGFEGPPDDVPPPLLVLHPALDVLPREGAGEGRLHGLGLHVGDAVEPPVPGVDLAHVRLRVEEGPPRVEEHDLDHDRRRARSAGFSVWCIPQAKMWHKVSLSAQRDKPLNRYHRALGQVRFYREHPHGPFPALRTAYIALQTARTLLKDIWRRDWELIGPLFRGTLDGYREGNTRNT